MHPRPTKEFSARAIEQEDKPAVIELAKSLTQFFPEDVIDLISASLVKRPVLVGVMDNEIVAFLVYTVRDAQTAEIIWMGVKEEYHGLGWAATCCKRSKNS
jgi:hypothetical protein